MSQASRTHKPVEETDMQTKMYSVERWVLRVGDHSAAGEPEEGVANLTQRGLKAFWRK